MDGSMFRADVPQAKLHGLRLLCGLWCAVAMQTRSASCSAVGTLRS